MLKTIIPSTSYQKVFILSLTEKDFKIWDDTHIRIKKRSILSRPVYLWDLYTLSDKIFKNTIDGFNIADPKDKNWHPIWLDSFKDNAGSKVYSRLETGFTVSPFNQSHPKKYIYSGDLGFSPLVSGEGPIKKDDSSKGNSSLDVQPVIDLYRDSETFAGEKAIWQSIIYPAFPIIFSSSVPTHEHFGPVFISRANFTVSGSSATNPVKISITWEGGKAIKTTPKQDVLPDVENMPDSGTIDFRHYRTASMIDVMLLEGIATTRKDLRSLTSLQVKAEKKDPQARIVSMDLSMEQTVNFEFPCHAPPKKTVTTRRDVHGPRFASISDRKVTGSVTYYSRTAKIDIPTTNSITMFFGGPFLFPMENIEWNYPEGDFQPKEGYMHKFEFVARACNDALVKAFDPNSSSSPISEFKIGTKL